jgi:hypothetical protein
MGNSRDLISTTEYRTLLTRCRINRCRYNRVRFYLSLRGCKFSYSCSGSFTLRETRCWFLVNKWLGDFRAGQGAVGKNTSFSCRKLNSGTSIQLVTWSLYWLSYFGSVKFFDCRSQWPCGVRRGSAAARLLGLWVWIPPRAWMSVCCECCVLSGRGLCDELVPRPEESYRVWCV